MANQADRWWTHPGRPRKPPSIAEPPLFASPRGSHRHGASPQRLGAGHGLKRFCVERRCCGTGGARGPAGLETRDWPSVGEPSCARCLRCVLGYSPLSGPPLASRPACGRAEPTGSSCPVEPLAGLRSPQTERKAAEVTGVANQADRWWTDPGRPEEPPSIAEPPPSASPRGSHRHGASPQRLGAGHGLKRFCVERRCCGTGGARGPAGLETRDWPSVGEPSCARCLRCVLGYSPLSGPSLASRPASGGAQPTAFGGARQPCCGSSESSNGAESR